MGSNATPEHERKYNSVEIEYIGNHIKKQFNGEYLFSEIESRKKNNYFLGMNKEELEKLELSIREDFGYNEGKVKFFWQEFEHLESI